MANLVEVQNNIGPIPQRAYLAASGVCMGQEVVPEWRDLMDPRTTDGPLLFSFNGYVNLEKKPEIPTGSRSVLQSMLVLLAGKSQTTVRIANEQIGKLACDIGVSPDEVRFLESVQTNNSIRAAFNEDSPQYGFGNSRGLAITSLERVREGNIYNVDTSDSYTQMATAVAFADFVKELPIPWYEVTELATGNGDHLSSLRHVISMLGEEGINLGEYTRIMTTENDRTEEGQMPSAIEHVLLKLQAQGVIDLRIDPMSKFLPEVDNQITRILENQEDLQAGRAVFYGFDADYVGTIVEAYNEQLAMGGEISTEAIFELIRSQNRQNFISQKQGGEKDNHFIVQHDVSVFLSRLNKKLAGDEFEVYPRVLPACETEVILKRKDLRFNAGMENVPAEVGVLLELAQRRENGFVAHSAVRELMDGILPADTKKERGDRSVIKFGQKYLDFQTETRGMMAGFETQQQAELYLKIVNAMNNFDARYAGLTQTESGRRRLISLFSKNLNLDANSGAIGYFREREEMVKTLLMYYLDISTRIRQALSGEKPTVQDRPGRNK